MTQYLTVKATAVDPIQLPEQKKNIILKLFIERESNPQRLAFLVAHL